MPLYLNLREQVCKSEKYTYIYHYSLTPSLLQHVTFPGWKMHGCTCKQCIFWSYNIYIKALHFDANMPVRKRHKNFKFRTFMGRFQMTWHWRGHTCKLNSMILNPYHAYYSLIATRFKKYIIIYTWWYLLKELTTSCQCVLLFFVCSSSGKKKSKQTFQLRI